MGSALTPRQRYEEALAMGAFLVGAVVLPAPWALIIVPAKTGGKGAVIN